MQLKHSCYHGDTCKAACWVAWAHGEAARQTQPIEEAEATVKAQPTPQEAVPPVEVSHTKHTPQNLDLPESAGYSQHFL